MRYIFLVNSFSLQNETQDVIKRIDIVAQKLYLDYIIEVNSNYLSTEDILLKYQMGNNIIVSVGGDGTINRVLNSIINTSNTLSFLPFGTGNDLARSCKEQLKNGMNKIDLVKINEQYFLNVACFGIDADIANDESFTNNKFIPKSQKYNMAILNNFFNYKARELKVKINHLTFENAYTTVAICNGKYYGGGYLVGPHASLNDGLLDVYLVNQMHKLAMMKIIASVKYGKHENSDKTTYIQTNNVQIEAPKAITCNIDGEKLTSQKFNIELINQGLNIYYDSRLIKEIDKIKIKKR